MRMPNKETAVAWCMKRLGADGSGFCAAPGIQLSRPVVIPFFDMINQHPVGSKKNSGRRTRPPFSNSPCPRTSCAPGMWQSAQAAKFELLVEHF
jgi:hypothetical protein